MDQEKRLGLKNLDFWLTLDKQVPIRIMIVILDDSHLHMIYSRIWKGDVKTNCKEHPFANSWQFSAKSKQANRKKDLVLKVHIFWEGHKNFAKSPPYFFPM